MPVPSPRNKLLPVRGNIATLTSNVGSLLEGEICYALDENSLYVVEGGSLVKVTAENIDDLADVDTSSVAPTDGQALLWDNAAGQWEPGNVGGNTDLTYTASTRLLESSTGTDVTLPEVVAAGNSGLMTGADKTKLDGIDAGAQVNVATDLTYTASTRVLASSTGTDATLPVVVAAGDSGLMTGADKTKLDGIDTGAQVNVATDLTYTASTRVLASSTGTDATLPNVVAAGDSGLMTGADKTKLDGITAGAEPNVATDLSYTASTRVLASSTGTDATLPVVVAAGDSGLMTGADKTKLDGITAGAEPNTVDSVAGKTGAVTLVKADITDFSDGDYATAAQGATADSAVQPTDSIDVLSDVDTTTVAPTDGQVLTWVNLNSRWEPAATSNAVDSVNSQTGAVVLDADDIDDTSTTHKFATAAQLANADSALQSGDNISVLTNDSGYITSTVTGDLTVDTSVLKVDSTNNRVGINQATPSVDLDVDGAYAGNITAVGALDIDCSTANYFTKTIAAGSTFTFSNAPSSRSYAFTLEVTHTSGTITWPTSVKWPGDTAPTLTTGKTHLFVFITDDGGTRWRGSSLVDYTN